jgi:hypothetical protein
MRGGRPADTRSSGRFGRAALCLTLAILVVAAQLGVFVHAVSHLPSPVLAAATDHSCTAAQTDKSSADEFCLECLAFAQVASAVPPPSRIAVESECLADWIPRSGVRIPHAANVVFLARGPPILV